MMSFMIPHGNHNFLVGLMQPIAMFVGNIGYVGVCILGGWLAMNGVIEIGDIQSFIIYVRKPTTRYLRLRRR